jgi:hypothetical protein
MENKWTIDADTVEFAFAIRSCEDERADFMGCGEPLKVAGGRGFGRQGERCRNELPPGWKDWRKADRHGFSAERSAIGLAKLEEKAAFDFTEDVGEIAGGFVGFRFYTQSKTLPDIESNTAAGIHSEIRSPGNG